MRAGDIEGARNFRQGCGAPARYKTDCPAADARDARVAAVMKKPVGVGCSGDDELVAWGWVKHLDGELP